MVGRDGIRSLGAQVETGLHIAVTVSYPLGRR